MDGGRTIPRLSWNCVEGNWKKSKGKIKEQWGKLSDDDLALMTVVKGDG